MNNIEQQQFSKLDLSKLPEDVVKALNKIKEHSDNFTNLDDVDKKYFDELYNGIQKDFPEAVEIDNGKKEITYKGFDVAGYNGERKSKNYEDYKGYKLVQYDVNEVDIVDKNNKSIEVVSDIERAKQFVDELQNKPETDLQKDLSDLKQLYEISKDKSLKQDIKDLEMLIEMSGDNSVFLKGGKILSTHKGKNVYKTNYKPLFAYNSLIKLLKQKGIDVYSSGKSRTTNTYYIESCNDDESLMINIRISDHTKYQESDDEGSYTNFYGGDTLEINIIDKDGFLNAKKEIEKYVKKFNK